MSGLSLCTGVRGPWLLNYGDPPRPRFLCVSPPSAPLCLPSRLVTAGVMHLAWPHSESTWSLRACPSSNCWISCLPVFSSRWLATFGNSLFSIQNLFNPTFQIRHLEFTRNLLKPVYYWNYIPVKKKNKFSIWEIKKLFVYQKIYFSHNHQYLFIIIM